MTRSKLSVSERLNAVQARSAVRRWLEAHYDDVRPYLHRVTYGAWKALAAAASWDEVIATPDAFRKAWQRIEKRRAAQVKVPARVGLSLQPASMPRVPAQHTPLRPTGWTPEGQRMWDRMAEDAGTLPRPVGKSTDKRGE